MFDKLWLSLRSYKFPGLRVLLKFLYIIGGIYITIYAVGLARYDNAQSVLQSKISNLVLAESKHRSYALERIPLLTQFKLPVKPDIMNPLKVFKACFNSLDDIDLETFEELYSLIYRHKKDLNNINLSGIIIPGDFFEESHDNFKNSIFKNTSLFRAILIFHNFQSSVFYDVNFDHATLIRNDFSYTNFVKTKFGHANLLRSNFCGAVFYDVDFSGADMSETILIGVDLVDAFQNLYALDMTGRYEARMPKLHAAYYNSEPISFKNLKTYAWIVENFNSCARTRVFPATKFPEGFNPKKAGMIDVSKLSDDEMIKICQHNKKLEGFSDISDMCKGWNY